MPRLGGETDKLGNRYEGLWVVDAALDVIEGEYVDLTCEPLGDEAAGVEFFTTKPTATREYHSIKRQTANGNWTISRLARLEGLTSRSILGDLIRKIQEGAEAVFSSGTSATELDELTDEARKYDSYETFQRRIGSSGRLSGCFRRSIVPLCGGDATAAYAALMRLRIRTKNHSTLTKDVERRIRGMFKVRTGSPLGAAAVRLLLGGFVDEKLGVTLTRSSFLEFLGSHDILESQLSGDSAVAQRMAQLNRSYLSGVNARLINRAPINRLEATAARSALVDRHKSVMLEGSAGGGKSCAAAQVVTELTNHSVPCLVIRLDQLTEADHSAQAIGARLGLPKSPAVTLGEFAGGQPSVLCIDQLDAVSLVSARQQSAWGAFNELLDEAHDYPDMRILFACRSFDLEQDARLRAVVADGERVERIHVGELDDDVVRAAIEGSGIAAGSLTQAQLQVLSTPLHLYLFLEAAQPEALNFTGRGDLFDAFWNHKMRAVEPRLANQGPGWTQTIAALCNAMSERESLAAPSYALDDYRESIEALASEAVVYIQDGRVGFFHEVFFDYAFARTFLNTSTDLVEWLASDEQPLFRRSQVRQVLAFLRDHELDRTRYLQTLRDLLGHSGVRFHIKKLVLDWLHGLPDPTTDEWAILEGLESELGGHLLSVAANSVPWFDVLQGMGRWQSWLTAEGQQADRAISLLQGPTVLAARSAEVVELVGPFQGQSEEWRSRLRSLVAGGHAYTSREMEDFAIALIADGTLDDARPGIGVNSDWWLIWYTLSTSQPAFIVRVLGAWFDRLLERAAELNLGDPFSGTFATAAHSQFSEHVIKESAARAPRDFVRELYPRLISFDRKVPQELVVAPNMLGRPHEQLRQALAEAMTALAKSDPAELDSIVDNENISGSRWHSAVLLQAWSANADHYGEGIINFILADPNQRLNISYDFAIGQVDIFVAVSRTAVAAASSACSDSSFAALEEAILRITPNWERNARHVGRTRLALLRALPRERISYATRQHLLELERRFPEASESGAAEQPSGRHVEIVGPPISSENQRKMSDDQWVSAMAEYTTEWSSIRSGQIVGGAVELSQGLTALVREDPARFTALVDRLEATHHPIYFGAILEGLTGELNSSSPVGALEQVCSVLRRIRDLGVNVRGADIARAVGSLAEEALPDDIVQMLCRIAVEDPDPEVDAWQGPDMRMAPINQAINTSRGQAALALARLLFADKSRWELLKPTIAQLVGDKVLSVRSVAVQCLLAVLDEHRSDARGLFEKLIDGAGSVLGTEFMERFTHYFMFRDYPAVRPTLLSMLQSPHPATVQAGARQLALAALWLDEAEGDGEIVREAGLEARSGAAEVYAENLPDQTVGLVCEQYLRELFGDESESVKREASRCWVVLSPDQIAERGSLVGAFAQSMRPDDDIGVLAYKLQQATLPLPVEVCDLAERALATYGAKAATIQFAEAGAAYNLAPLMIRLHEETSDPIIRRRILDAIDGMVRAGFFGINERLRQQDNR